MARTPVTQKALMDAIRASRGNITAVAQSFRRSRQAIYRRIRSMPKVLEVLDESRETMVDAAEGILHEKVLAGDITALIFFLKTQGKGRGYIERGEVEHAGIVRVIYDSIDPGLVNAGYIKASKD
jgi:hypothetical protein